MTTGWPRRPSGNVILSERAKRTSRRIWVGGPSGSESEFMDSGRESVATKRHVGRPAGEPAPEWSRPSHRASRRQ